MSRLNRKCQGCSTSFSSAEEAEGHEKECPGLALEGPDIPPDMTDAELRETLQKTFADDDVAALDPETQVRVLETVEVQGLQRVRWGKQVGGDLEKAAKLPADTYEITTTDADREAGNARLTLVLSSGWPSAKHAYVAPLTSITALVIGGKIRPAETRS